MKLQGLGLIDIAFNHWLKKHGFSARIYGADTDFFWYHNDTISYSFFFGEASLNNWNLLLEELGCNYDIDPFYSAFLHELGHSNTYRTFPTTIIRECERKHREICRNPNACVPNPEYAYTHLPVEYEATRWAVNFINEHPDAVLELVELVGKAVRLFYNINDIQDEELEEFLSDN